MSSRQSQCPGSAISEITIREADASDRDFLLGLAPRLAGVPRPEWHTLEAMEAFQACYMAATLANASKATLTLVAVSANAERLGYVHAHPGKDGVTGELCGHVAIIALKEDAEGRGVAGTLMQRAELWAKAEGYRLLSLDVFSDNRRALEFYLRGGFRAESIRLVKPLVNGFAVG